MGRSSRLTPNSRNGIPWFNLESWNRKAIRLNSSGGGRSKDS